MSTWISMDYTRIVGGAFVPAELLLDLAGRDYGSMDMVVDWSLDTETFADNDDVWTDLFGIYIGWPDSWAIDPAWGLYLRASVQIYFSFGAGDPMTSYKWRLTTYGTEQTGVGWKTLTADIPLSATPTGMTEYKVQGALLSTGNTNITAVRTPGDKPPDSWRLVTL